MYSALTYLRVGVAVATLVLGCPRQSPAVYDPTQDVMTITRQFKTTDVVFAGDAVNVFSPLASYGGSTYLVWISSSLHPMVAKITDGDAQTARLDPDDSYTVLDDAHHKFSLGIDKYGYIHITGDMHSHPYFMNPTLPDRYRNSMIMYWVSDSPQDISSFTFVGKDSSRAIPGYGYSYGSFHSDLNMELYYVSRIAVRHALYQPGDLGVGLYRYDAESRSWEALGGLPPSGGSAEFPCILWEDNGNDGRAYQGFMASVRFDSRNRLHFAATINADDSSGASHVVYGYSDDGGETFYRADGTPVAYLPMRVEGGPAQGDIVEGPVHFVTTHAGVFFDKYCTPAVNYVRYIDDVYMPGNYRAWSESLGTWGEMMTTPATGGGRERNHVDGNGVLTFVDGTYRGHIYRTLGFGMPGKRFPTWAYSVHDIDELGLRETNVFRSMAISTELGKVTLSVVRIDFTNAAAGPPVMVVRTDSIVAANGAYIDYGQTELGIAVTKVFVVENDGDTGLNLGEIAVPDGFSVVERPPSWIMPGTSSDIAVRLDADAAGQYSGDLSIPTNDAENDPFILILSGEVGTSGCTDPGVPTTPTLAVSPNPFQRSTAVCFTLARPSRVSLEIYDTAGRRLRRLTSGSLPEGYHSIRWDGVGPKGEPLAPGIYLLSLRIERDAVIRKVVKLR